MNPLEALQDDDFRKVLDHSIKGYIDEAMTKAGQQAPIPTSVFPLQYGTKQLDSAVKRMQAGAQVGLSVYARYLAKKGQQQ